MNQTAETTAATESALAGRVALVTGGGTELGRATSLALAKAGASVVVADGDPQGLRETVDQLRDCSTAPPVLDASVDVRSEDSVRAMVRRTLGRLGRIDILVHAAAIRPGGAATPRMLSEVLPEEMHAVIDTNLKGTFLCNQAVLGPMIEQGGGQIVNICSTAGRKGRAFDAVYCASQFGVIGLSESLAEEVRRHGIRVQVVLLDAVDAHARDPSGAARCEDSLPPERVAALIRFMLTLPPDAILENVVVSLFRGRQRRPRAKP